MVTTYRATASGHRLAQQSGSDATEVTLREGATVLGSMTVDAAGTPTAWHFNLLAGTQAVGRQPSTGSRRYYHTDLLGSVRAVVTGTTVVESTDYDPWGVVLAGRTLSSGTKEGFTGQPRDLATGLDDFGARAYLSAFGRWGGVDPAAGVMPEWSPYAYVLNNPLGDRDADGQLPVSKMLKLAKALYQGGDLAAAFADNIHQVRTLADAGASDGAKLWAGAQLLVSVALPVDVSDVQGAAGLVGRALGRADEAGDVVRSTGTATRRGGDATEEATCARFIGQPDGQLVDTRATPRGSYDQPGGGRTDVLQREDHGAGLSHTHDPIVNTNPTTGRVFINGKEKTGRPVSPTDIANIRSGAATPSPPRVRP